MKKKAIKKKPGRTQIADERHKAESPGKTSSIMKAFQVQQQDKVSGEVSDVNREMYWGYIDKGWFSESRENQIEL